MLHENQQLVSAQFGSRADDKFAGIDWRPSELGSPVLGGTLAHIDCTVHSVHDGGDHFVVFGAVQTMSEPQVELILRESDEISRLRPGVLIVRHRLGFTSANAGIDRSNVAQSGDEETVLLLPLDPDASAARLRDTLRRDWGCRSGW